MVPSAPRSTAGTPKTDEGPQKTRKRRRSFRIPLTTADAFELDRWAETPVTFTNSRWLKPIARHREDLYLYSPKGAQYTADGLRALEPMAR